MINEKNKPVDVAASLGENQRKTNSDDNYSTPAAHGQYFIKGRKIKYPPILFDGIPQALKELNQWMCWRAELKSNGKTDKIPCCVYHPGGDVTKPDDWCSFEEAQYSYEKGYFDGIGFVFSKEAGIVGIDLDNSVNPDGTLIPSAAAIVEAFDSFSEYSVSGKGLHIFIRANLLNGIRKSQIEIYPHSRFFTMTGRTFGEHTQINERQLVLDNLVAKLRAKPILKRSPVYKPRYQPSSAQEVIKIGCERYPQFNRLWNGDLSDVDNDDSRADFVLLMYLLKFTGGNEGLSLSLFEQSALYERDKAQRPDYLPRTLAAARQLVGGGF